ncbi:MAG: Gldg family protein [Ignavibacteriales bacterium]|nr:Gldg family protein [Ignavibacteriales bacterium]
MKNKKSQLLVRVLLVLGILVVLNFISIRLFGRLDLTSQGVYTLSDASKKIVGSLDDRVTVKAFFTEDLPAPYNNNRRSVLDILNDYKAYSRGNLQFEFISPQGEKGEQDAQQQGISPVQVQVVNEDKLEVKRGYLGLLLLYEDRKEVLPVVQNLSTLEYDISSALKRLTSKAKKKVGYTTGHGETEVSAMRQAYQAETQQYDLIPVDLSKGEAVPSDIAALLVIAPQRRLQDSAQYQIDQYLMRGGKVAFLLNRVNANLQMRMGQPLDIGLDGMLQQYGVGVNPDLVRDAQCANISVMQQQGDYTFQSQVPFPYIPVASNFNGGNPIVKDLQGVILHFVSSVDTSGAASKGLKSEVLVRSSKHSGRQTGMFMIDPFQRYTAADLGENGIPLAAIIEGSFKSFFVGKQPAAAVASSPETRILVAGDGDFMKDEMLGNKGNLTFFANIIDYLADDAGLITIRSKNVATPPLDQIADGTKRALKYANLIGPPVLIVMYGLFRWRKRVAFKKAMEAQSL